MDAFANQALSLAAGRLSAFYAIRSDGSSGYPLRLQVTAVSNAHDYASLLRYLGNLTAVRTVIASEHQG